MIVLEEMPFALMASAGASLTLLLLELLKGRPMRVAVTSSAAKLLIVQMEELPCASQAYANASFDLIIFRKNII